MGFEFKTLKFKVLEYWLGLSYNYVNEKYSPPMKNNVIIISFNNFGISFWRNHLELSTSNVRLFEASGHSDLSFKELNPSVVIIDSYFHKESNEKSIMDLFQRIKHEVKEAPIFHFSPNYSDEACNDFVMLGIHKTVICKEAFWMINQVLNPSLYNDLTA